MTSMWILRTRKGYFRSFALFIANAFYKHRKSVVIFLGVCLPLSYSVKSSFSQILHPCIAHWNNYPYTWLRLIVCGFCYWPFSIHTLVHFWTCMWMYYMCSVGEVDGIVIIFHEHYTTSCDIPLQHFSWLE